MGYDPGVYGVTEAVFGHGLGDADQWPVTARLYTMRPDTNGWCSRPEVLAIGRVIDRLATVESRLPQGKAEHFVLKVNRLIASMMISHW